MNRKNNSIKPLFGGSYNPTVLRVPDAGNMNSRTVRTEVLRDTVSTYGIGAIELINQNTSVIYEVYKNLRYGELQTTYQQFIRDLIGNVLSDQYGKSTVIQVDYYYKNGEIFDIEIRDINQSELSSSFVSERTQDSNPDYREYFEVKATTFHKIRETNEMIDTMLKVEKGINNEGLKYDRVDPPRVNEPSIDTFSNRTSIA